MQAVPNTQDAIANPSRGRQCPRPSYPASHAMVTSSGRIQVGTGDGLIGHMPANSPSLVTAA